MEPSSQYPSTAAQPALPNPAMPAPVAPPTATQPAPGAAPMSTAPNAPDVADDSDRIEKEWVNRVKQIIQQTAADPYEQNRQFSILKADYMQKRYGKTIKSED